jgi:hypothetical protein
MSLPVSIPFPVCVRICVCVHVHNCVRVHGQVHVRIHIHTCTCTSTYCTGVALRGNTSTPVYYVLDIVLSCIFAACKSDMNLNPMQLQL